MDNMLLEGTSSSKDRRNQFFTWFLYFICFYVIKYTVSKGNNSGIVERVLSSRKHWKKSTNSKVFDFKWT